MKTTIGYTVLTVVRCAMIGCIVKITLLWQPVAANTDILASISKAFFA